MSKRELTNEEELLLQDFSGTLSAKATSLFYGNALIVAALPICESETHVRPYRLGGL